MGASAESDTTTDLLPVARGLGVSVRQNNCRPTARAGTRVPRDGVLYPGESPPERAALAPKTECVGRVGGSASP